MTKKTPFPHVLPGIYVPDHHFASDMWLEQNRWVLGAVCSCESPCVKEGCEVFWKEDQTYS